MTYGSFGRYADIDLSSNELCTYDIPVDWRRRFLGGRGIGAMILSEELPHKVDPLGPENILVFATGPFQGTGVAGGSRVAILSTSPATSSVSDSFAGGFFPHELGRSGFDGLVIRGRAERPVYIFVNSGTVEIREATDIWGKDVLAVDRLLKDRHPGVRVATIGVGGERRIPFATVMTDVSRAAGRPGFGSVMGSKKLKAVVVAGGVEKPISDPELFSRLRQEYATWLMEDPATRKRRRLGTAKCVMELNDLGILPTKNFQCGTFAGADRISGEAIASDILVGRASCVGCPVACKRRVRTSFNEEDVVAEYGGMEYETVAALGSLCMVDDLSAIALASQRCNAYGLDTITTGVSIAAAMEATEKGYVKDDGITWGDGRALVAMIDLIARRDGLGALLARGMEAIKEEWGDEFVLGIKGQAVPLHDVRAKKGMGISYATSPRGATHMEGFDDEMLIDIIDPSPQLGIRGVFDWRGWSNKPELCVTYENLMSFTNSLVMCAFVSVNKAAGPYYPYDRILQILEALTGEAIDTREMLEIGDRNYRLLEALRKRLVGTKKDDLPPRFKTPLPTGPCAGNQITDRELQRAIAAYRSMRSDRPHLVDPS